MSKLFGMRYEILSEINANIVHDISSNMYILVLSPACYRVKTEFE